MILHAHIPLPPAEDLAQTPPSVLAYMEVRFAWYEKRMTEYEERIVQYEATITRLEARIVDLEAKLISIRPTQVNLRPASLLLRGHPKRTHQRSAKAVRVYISRCLSRPRSWSVCQSHL